MIAFPEKIEQYIQLVGAGKTDSEIAEEMQIKLGTIQGSYRGRALALTGLTSKEELALYARQGNGSAEAQDDKLADVLQGTIMEPVRDFYRRLEIHYLCNHCVGCKSYHQYGVMVVNGNLEYHLEQFCPPEKDVRVFLYHLKEKHVLEVQEHLGVYRVTFSYFVPQEKEAC